MAALIKILLQTGKCNGTNRVFMFNRVIEHQKYTEIEEKKNKQWDVYYIRWVSKVCA